MPRTARAALVACIVCLAVVSSGRPVVRAQDPTFRGGVDLVQLDVVVLDRNRRPVTGLTASDFTILEEGKPRPIDAFSAVTLPSNDVTTTGPAWLREVAPDVVDNARPGEGRLVVIFMDRSIPVEAGVLRARAIASAAVDSLGPGDLAAVVSSSGFSNEGRPQNFTGDRTRLKAAIDEPFMGLVNPPGMTPGGLQRSGPDLLRSGDCLCGICVMDALERVADAMAAERRMQKTLLFIGSNVIVQVKDPPECALHLRNGRERALRALDRANVTVHAIDPSGLETLSKGADAFPADARPSVAATLERQGNLGVFPGYTGGRVVLNTNAPEAQVPAIFAESQSYYLIGFQRAVDGPATSRRSIRVRVNGEGLTVRSRTAYYAGPVESPAPASAEPSVRVLAPLLPVGGLPLKLALTPRFSADGSSEVDVRVGVADDGDGDDRRFEITVAVLDERARPLGGATQTVEVPANIAGAVETQMTLPLTPGHYELRVGVAEPDRDLAGSVYGYVHVPDVSRQPLALSGILLAAPEDLPNDAPASAEAPLAKPTLRRTFAPDETVSAAVQIYVRDTSHVPVTLQTRIVGADDRVVARSTQTLDAARFSAARIADVALPMPVSTLAPGHYLLTIEAASGEYRQKRDVRFEIR